MKYLLYVLLFAVAAAVLYVWGLSRSRSQQKTMEAMLLGKCEKRIRRHLRKNGAVARDDARRLVDGVSVRLFYSKKRLAVTEPDAFADALLTRMEKAGTIRRSEEGDSYLAGGK